jgi:hypothetical protein
MRSSTATPIDPASLAAVTGGANPAGAGGVPPECLEELRTANANAQQVLDLSADPTRTQTKKTGDARAAAGASVNRMLDVCPIDALQEMISAPKLR